MGIAIVTAGGRRGPGHAALGEALSARGEEILLECQRRYRDVSGDLQASDPIWRELSLATRSIAGWLRSDRGELAETPRRSRVQLRDGARLRVTPLVELTFWWCEIVNRVLTEEAERLGLAGSVLHAATAATFDTGKAGVIELAKSCDVELESLRRRVADPVRRDPLTGLATRTSLLEQLDRALAKLLRQPNGLALIVIGVDDPTEACERLGRPGRDAVLVELGSRLNGGVRPGDLVARVEQDEFAVLFEGLIGPSEAKRRAEGLRRSASLPVSVAGSRVAITVSAGAVTVRLPDKEPEDVVAWARQAMHRAREAGGDRVHVVEVDRGRPLVVAERAVGQKTGAPA
jgi:diguanylate cyclase (GGDEF)-like protein